MITLKPNILSFSECDEIIFNCKNKMEPSMIVTSNGPKLDPWRISDSTYIYENPPIIQKIKNITSQITQLPISYQEPISVIRYKTGGEYKYHTDYIDYIPSDPKRNRAYSCMFYLNDDLEGGETHFPKLQLSIKPTKGTLVKWDNLNLDDTPNPNSLHAGLPVTKGEKWILIIWVHNNLINK